MFYEGEFRNEGELHVDRTLEENSGREPLNGERNGLTVEWYFHAVFRYPNYVNKHARDDINKGVGGRYQD